MVGGRGGRVGWDVLSNWLGGGRLVGLESLRRGRPKGRATMLGGCVGVYVPIY